MSSITISKREYEKLLEKKMRYDYLRSILEEDFFSPPKTRDSKIILKAFKETKRYSSNFLKSLERGLKRSSYFK